MKTKLTILAAMAAFSMLAQDAKTAPAKPPYKGMANSPTPVPKEWVVTDPNAVAVAPSIATAKLWRLVARAQALRMQANETKEAKEAKAAEEELQAEQVKLTNACGLAFTLGYQQDAKAENAGDLVCVPKPKEQATAAPAPNKEK